MVSRLLLVEDDLASITFVEEALDLSSISSTLTILHDGQAALDYLQDYSNPTPHLIILDLNLPKKSGLEVLKEIKEDSVLKVIPVLIMSNSNADVDIQTAYQNSCNAYVQKPMGFDAFLEAFNAAEKFWFETVSHPK